MFRNVLVPVDFTPPNRQALQVAAEMARTWGSRVTLIHVIERLEHVPDEELRDFYGELKRRSEAEMARLARHLEEQGVRPRTVVLLGKRLDDILRFAVEEKADLIVLSSHRVQPGEPVTRWGTLSYRIGILSPCPVLLVKGPRQTA